MALVAVHLNNRTTNTRRVSRDLKTAQMTRSSKRLMGSLPNRVGFRRKNWKISVYYEKVNKLYYALVNMASDD